MVNIYLLVAALAAAPAMALPNYYIFPPSPSVCNRDDCLGGVAARSTRLAHCSSLMAVTVIPCAATVTNTATVTSTTTINSFSTESEVVAAPSVVALEESQQRDCTTITQIPTNLPTYAASICTPCGSTGVAARLSSACACNGVTAMTTTAPTPTITVTTTAIVTETFESTLLASTSPASTATTVVIETSETTPTTTLLTTTDPASASTEPTAMITEALEDTWSTLSASTSTSTSTSTSMTTETPEPEPRPTAFALHSSGDQSLMVSVDETGALRLTRDRGAVVPFYVDDNGQLRNFYNPERLWVDVYEPSSGTADNKVYNAVPDETRNFRITCNYYGRRLGEYWGGCQASGPPNGNPVVYGFGTCPNQGAYVYMIPNNSNVRCPGGYAFLGFFLREYIMN